MSISQQKFSNQLNPALFNLSPYQWRSAWSKGLRISKCHCEECNVEAISAESILPRSPRRFTPRDDSEIERRSA